MKKRPFKETVVRGSLATFAVVGALMSATAAAPANAAASSLSIGYTINDNGTIKGSGGMYNSGDWTNVCVVIMRNVWGPQDLTMSCKGNQGSHTWSAPDYGNGRVNQISCTTFYTRITAYRNGTRVAEKVSNYIRAGRNC